MSSVPEVGRRLVDGVWVTNVANEGGGGGSLSVTDGSVTVDPATAIVFSDGFEVAENPVGTAELTSSLTINNVLATGRDANQRSIDNLGDLTLTNGGINLSSNGSITDVVDVSIDDDLTVGGDLKHEGPAVGFYGTSPVAKPTGVAVDAAGIHAALVDLGLIDGP